MRRSSRRPTGRAWAPREMPPAPPISKVIKFGQTWCLVDKTQTSIYDLDAQKMYIFNSNKKKADVWDMAAFAQELSKTVDLSSMKASFKANGQTKEVGGHKANGYDMEVSVRSAMAGG